MDSAEYPAGFVSSLVPVYKNLTNVNSRFHFVTSRSSVNYATQKYLSSRCTLRTIRCCMGTPSAAAALQDTSELDLNSQPVPYGEVNPDETESEAEAESEVYSNNEMMELILFSIPVFGSMISDPLMGVVDTACVGKVSTLHLAALGPAMNVFLFLANVFGFIGTSTATMVASNTIVTTDSEQQKVIKAEKTKAAVRSGILISLALGFVCTCVLLFKPFAILKATGATGELLAPAVQYSQIRALGIIGMLLSFVAHGACMAQGDPNTPLYSFAFAGILNFVLDLVLIFKLGMGVAGAALATSVSTYGGLALIAFVMYRRERRARKMFRNSQREGAHHVPGTNVTILNKKVKSDIFANSLVSFGRIGGSLLLRQIATMTTYSILTTLASGQGTLPLAVHQVSLQLFWFLTFISEPLSVCGQTLIARTHAMKERTQRLTKAVLTLAAACAVAAAGLTAVAHLGFPAIFTSDPLVMEGMKKLTPLAMIAHLLVAPVIALDGLAIGFGDFKSLPLINGVSFVLTTAFTLLMTTIFEAGLGAIWAGLGLSFLVRFVLHVARILYLKSRKGSWPPPFVPIPSPNVAQNSKSSQQ